MAVVGVGTVVTALVLPGGLATCTGGLLVLAVDATAAGLLVAVDLIAPLVMPLERILSDDTSKPLGTYMSMGGERLVSRIRYTL